MCHKIEGTETVVFICPYGNVAMSFKPEDHHLYAETYRINKWRFLDVDIDAHPGIDCSFQITGPLAGVKNVIMFIISKKWAKDGNLYYEVVLPDSQSPELCILFPGVNMRGKSGWVPQQFLSIGDSKNPFFYSKQKADEGNTLTFAFRPFVCRNKILQWGY